MLPLIHLDYFGCTPQLAMEVALSTK